MIRYVLIAILLFISCENPSRRISLPEIFSDGMVLQRDTTVAIWGYSSPNQVVNITGSWGYKVSTTSDANGRWHASINTKSDPGPHLLKLQNEESSIEIKDILMGEVWLASGQSNMEMTFDYCCNSTDSSAEEINNANYHEIRMFNVKKNLGAKPIEFIKGNWVSAVGAKITNFSAVGYFFAKKLNKDLGVPIGIINSSWGSSNAEAWTSFDAISGLEEFEDQVASTEDLIMKSKESMDWYQNFTEIPSPSHEWDFVLDKIINKHNPNIKYSSYFFYKWADLDHVGKDIINASSKNNLWSNMDSSLDVDRIIGTKDFKGITIFKNEFLITDNLIEPTLIIEPEKNIPGLWEYDIFINGERIASSLIEIEIEDYKNPKAKEEFSIDTKFIKEGVNRIIVRVIGYSKLGKIKILNNEQVNVLDDNKWNFKILAEEYHQLKNFKYPYTSFYLFNDSLIDHSKAPEKTFYGRNSLSSLFNGMINPLIPYTIKGVIWYQGESNVADFYNYKKLMPILIDDWRTRWGYDFPFYFAQLANYFNYGGMLSRFRSEQKSLLNIPKTGMVVTLDIGENYDIHPSNKHDVGDRFGRLALKKTYGFDIIDSGPLFKNFKKRGYKLEVYFNHTGLGLTINKDSDRTWFEIAGQNKQYHEAQAINHASYIELFSPFVKNPEFVRYAWSDTAGATLFNQDGLPASPFSSEYE